MLDRPGNFVEPTIILSRHDAPGLLLTTTTTTTTIIIIIIIIILLF